MKKTTSERKAFIYCEAQSKNDNIYVEIRVYCISKDRSFTYRCTPYQALSLLVNPDYNFKWFQIF